MVPSPRQIQIQTTLLITKRAIHLQLTQSIHMTFLDKQVYKVVEAKRSSYIDQYEEDNRNNKHQPTSLINRPLFALASRGCAQHDTTSLTDSLGFYQLESSVAFAAVGKSTAPLSLQPALSPAPGAHLHSYAGRTRTTVRCSSRGWPFPVLPRG